METMANHVQLFAPFHGQSRNQSRVYPEAVYESLPQKSYSTPSKIMILAIKVGYGFNECFQYARSKNGSDFRLIHYLLIPKFKDTFKNMYARKHEVVSVVLQC